MKNDENMASGSSTASGADDVRDPSAPQPASGLKWRIVVAVIVLAALAALVYKQSF